MPLRDGYGVLIGGIARYYRDPPDDYGQYYHGNLEIDVHGGRYRCAIDVDSKASDVGVEWRVAHIESSEIESILSLGPGWHALASTPASGAIDYIRSPMFRHRLGCLSVIAVLLRLPFGIERMWRRGNSVQALTDLEPLVRATQEAGLQAVVFGAPFRSGLGVHDIHQNQGDPAGSQWWPENGVWQDGATILQQSADRYAVFMNKFTSQAYWTDDQGHPK